MNYFGEEKVHPTFLVPFATMLNTEIGKLVDQNYFLKTTTDSYSTCRRDWRD
jgi:hypothetical protein